MVLRFNVGGKVVDRVDLIRKKKWPWSLDVLPCAVLYAIWMVTIVPSIDIVDALIVLGGLVSIHVLTLLFTAWSIDFKCFVQYSKIFCVGLWCLDEYWYYSLLTLFMLFMFESTMAKSRLKTLSELRRVRLDTQIVTVHRCGKWVKLSGTDLLPGDVVSIGRSSGQNGEDKSVPADMLLLAGSAIVNEAILTGESTPQWKERHL